MAIHLTIRLEASEVIRAYSTPGGNIGYIPGDTLGYVQYIPKLKRWQWWSSCQGRGSGSSEGFASLEEALVDFAKNSHPEPLEIAGIKAGEKE